MPKNYSLLDQLRQNLEQILAFLNANLNLIKEKLSSDDFKKLLTILKEIKENIDMLAENKQAKSTLFDDVYFELVDISNRLGHEKDGFRNLINTGRLLLQSIYNTNEDSLSSEEDNGVDNKSN